MLPHLYYSVSLLALVCPICTLSTIHTPFPQEMKSLTRTQFESIVDRAVFIKHPSTVYEPSSIESAVLPADRPICVGNFLPCEGSRTQKLVSLFQKESVVLEIPLESFLVRTKIIVEKLFRVSSGVLRGATLESVLRVKP